MDKLEELLKHDEIRITLGSRLWIIHNSVTDCWEVIKHSRHQGLGGVIHSSQSAEDALRYMIVFANNLP